jgi:hypothetical protein
MIVAFVMRKPDRAGAGADPGDGAHPAAIAENARNAVANQRGIGTLVMR